MGEDLASQRRAAGIATEIRSERGYAGASVRDQREKKREEVSIRAYARAKQHFHIGGSDKKKSSYWIRFRRFPCLPKGRFSYLGDVANLLAKQNYYDKP